jgi:hypothetical protein
MNQRYFPQKTMNHRPGLNPRRVRMRIAFVAVSCSLLAAADGWMMPSVSSLSFVPPRSRYLSSQTVALVAQQQQSRQLLYSTFSSDGSEYSSQDSSDLDEDEDGGVATAAGFRNNNKDEDETPTVELQPVPMSKNSGNRFVVTVWDRDLNTETQREAMDLHQARIELTEDHVMVCRKANLYNETFNTNSMVDVIWSYPMYVFAICVRDRLVCVYVMIGLYRRGILGPSHHPTIGFLYLTTVWHRICGE